MITTINEFRKLYENKYPEGDFIKYNYNDTPDMEEVINQAASAMGEMTDSLYWMDVREPDELPGVMKDITGDETYDFDKVESYFTKQGAVKLYITNDTDAYYIICNTNMNGKTIVDDQIVNSFDEFDNSQSEDLGDLDNSQDERAFDDNDLDPAGGRGFHTHEGKSDFSRQLLNITMTLQKLMKQSEGNSAVVIELNNTIKQVAKLNLTIFKNLVKEGAVKRHWEEINNAIQAKLPLKYKSGENFGEAVPTLYTNNVVTFDNGINVIDMYIQTEVNNINE